MKQTIKQQKKENNKETKQIIKERKQQKKLNNNIAMRKGKELSTYQRLLKVMLFLYSIPIIK
jgi:hypothetical protein